MKCFKLLFAGGIGVSNDSQGRSGVPILVNPVMSSYFKHSCNPNVLDFVSGGKTIRYSVKPIKQREQLSILIASRDIEEMNTKQRKKFLWDMLKLKCE